MKKTTQLTLLSVLVAVISIAGSMQQVRANTPSEMADAQSEGTIKVAAVTKDAIDQMADDQRKLTKAQNQEARDSAEAAYQGIDHELEGSAQDGHRALQRLRR